MANRHKTFRRWFNAKVDREACRCICEYGIAQAAPGGLIYYRETQALYDAYTDEIWELMLESHGCLGVYVQGIGNRVMFENWMVWAAASQLAYERLYPNANRFINHAA